MADAFTRRLALLCLLLAALPGCGKKGPLYLPDTAGEVVTRPAESPPPAESTAVPDSPQTVDSQPATESNEESSRKDKGGTPPPPK